MKYILLILSIILLPTLVFADTNGIWINAQDVRGGIFGSDESNRDFSFIGILNLTTDTFYKGTLLEDVFVLENQINSISTDMIQIGAVTNDKIADNTIRIGKVRISDFDNRYYQKNEVYNKIESDNKYALLSDTYTQTQSDSRYVNRAGDSMSGVLNMGGNRIRNVASPSSGNDVVTKTYVDNLLSTTSNDIRNVRSSLSGCGGITYAQCPSGYTIIGGGAHTYNTNVNDCGVSGKYKYWFKNYPDFNNNRWVSQMRGGRGYSYAICIRN